MQQANHAGPSTQPAGSTAPSTASGGKADRLFVGNLAPTVDEYTLLQVFSKCGKITSMDFMFHKTGVMKGKPRGYAFVEYATAEVSHHDDVACMVLMEGRPEGNNKAT